MATSHKLSIIRPRRLGLRYGLVKAAVRASALLEYDPVRCCSVMLQPVAGVWLNQSGTPDRVGYWGSADGNCSLRAFQPIIPSRHKTAEFAERWRFGTGRDDDFESLRLDVGRPDHLGLFVCIFDH